MWVESRVGSKTISGEILVLLGGFTTRAPFAKSETPETFTVFDHETLELSLKLLSFCYNL